MKVNGRDCTITIKTASHEYNQRLFDIPYSEETIREAVSILQEEAAIEGDGNCKAIVKKSGVTGCVVTPLTIDNVPLLLYLAFGSAGKPLYVSQTKNVYSSKLNLLPLEDTECFDLIQDRGNERRVFEDCRIQGFEFRIENDNVIKLKLDVCGERFAKTYLYTDIVERTKGERFKSDCVDYYINGKENHFIYGITLSVKKIGGTKAEIWIKRILPKDNEFPENINELIISARLLSSKYEINSYGLFNIKLKNLVLISDETHINSSDTIIDPLRYYVSGGVEADVYTVNDECL
jgi:hypothetical protein